MRVMPGPSPEPARGPASAAECVVLDGLLGELEARPLLLVAVGIAEALAELHTAGQVHGGLEPSLIAVNLSTGRARLGARWNAGSLAYIAPESSGRSANEVDQRADLYSLGVCLYQLATGKLPFTADEPRGWLHAHLAVRPAPPSEPSDMPLMLPHVLLRLLEKEPADRYQTASGLAHDLRECLARLAEGRAHAAFPLGRRDLSGQLARQAPLVGRAQELDTLAAALARVERTGVPELLYLPGFSGSGKSSLLQHFLRQPMPPDALVVSAKFDDRESDAPYATLMQLFRELLRWVLARPARELAEWQAALSQALGSNAGIIAELVPELAHVVSGRATELQMPADETKNRIFASFRRMLRVFVTRARFVLVFLDDVQWIDPASLRLLEHLLVDPDLERVLVIVAYREESVAADHVFAGSLERLREAGLALRSVPLEPLPTADVERMVAELLCGAPEQTLGLSRIVERKTGGNPFFVRQFLAALKEEELLRFDPTQSAWSWDLPRIAHQAPTDNLTDLLLERLTRLPKPTQTAIETLACLGARASAPLLAELSGNTVDGLAESLGAGVVAQVVTETRDGYAFSHDRLQTAAYSRIPEHERPYRHLAIGRALRARSHRERDDALFDVVRHLNRASDLLTDAGERLELAEMNLRLARRARSSAATASALSHVEQGLRLLPAAHWEISPALSFELSLAQAESEYANGRHARAESLLADLAAQNLDSERLGAVVCVQLAVYTASQRWADAMAVGLAYLRSQGIPWLTLSEEELRAEHRRFKLALAAREVQSLGEAAPLTSAAVRVLMEVCHALVVPSTNAGRHAYPLIYLRLATLSLEHGNCDLSVSAYANLTTVLGPVFGEHELGLEFGKLAGRMAEVGDNRFVATARLAMGLLAPKVFDPHAGCAWLRRACEAADQFGDLVWGSYTRFYLLLSLLGSGAPLDETEREADRAIEYAVRHRFRLLANRLRVLRSFIRGLRDPSWPPGSLGDDQLDEAEYEQQLDGLDLPYYWLRRLEARYFAGDFSGAREAARRTSEVTRNLARTPYEIELWFYCPLAEAAAADSSDPTEALQHMAADERELLSWAERCPATFASKVALAGAERARLERRHDDAELGFEKAVEYARQHALIHEEALAHELAARFYAGRGITSVARAKVSLARSCYLRWGARGKASLLDAQLGILAEPRAALGEALELLDLKVVVSALQAVSSSLELEKLVEDLMTIALEHGASERGLLVLLANEPRIRARASLDAAGIRINPADVPVSADSLPESILRYVLRSGEPVATHDGVVPKPFDEDRYFEQCSVRSLLCLPVMLRGKAIGALYLENTLTRQNYGAHRLAVLQLIASQAAISLENARLYAGIHRAQQRMARAERVSRTGSFSWRPDTLEIEFSDELSRIYGIDGPPSLALLRQRVHPEDRPLFDAMANDTARYEGQTVEHRLVMPDGAIKYVAAIASRLDTDEYAGTVRDVTETKQAEEALNRTRAALTDMTRLGSLAEMAAAIAHEVNQPITGIALNANTSLRRLQDDRLDIAGARDSVTRIRTDADRAASVVQRLRALFGRTEGKKTQVDLNAAIAEVVALSRSRLRAGRTTLTLELSTDLSAVLGDRVQLQQVVMNLLNNGVDAMSAQPLPRTLTIRTLPTEKGQVRCEVEDNGAGVPETDRTRIFEPFYTTKHHGMGMGLSICRNILTSHGGELAVDHRMDRRGANFYFVLPSADRAGGRTR